MASEGTNIFTAVPSVPDFYTDQELFVTGATGFLGKSLLEKLLFACPNIKTIYLLLRPKRGCAVDQRLETLKRDLAFDRIRETNPKVLDKLVAIEGDVRELGLLMSEASMERIKNVSILVHGAATVRFDEPLKESIIMNTRGTREVLNMAKRLKNLKLFAHISTAYTNPQKELTEEKLYPIEDDWRSVIKMAETLDVETLEAVSKKFVGYHPNSYTYSKQLSEQMVNDYRKDLPIIIQRPSIVSPSIEEPCSGWVDNFNGPVGLMLPISIGFSRILLGKASCPLNFVPVDYISNSLIAVMAQSATHMEQNRGQQLDEVPIYNYGVDKREAIKISEIMDHGMTIVAKYPMDNMVWYPSTTITTSVFLYSLFFYFVQLMPGLIAELLLRTLKYDFRLATIILNMAAMIFI